MTRGCFTSQPRQGREPPGSALGRPEAPARRENCAGCRAGIQLKSHFALLCSLTPAS